MTKRKITESGFRVEVDTASSFRFAELKPYRSLSGLRLREMDVGWWDANHTRLVLLELKGAEIWQKFDISVDTASAHMVAVLREKATDALMLLASAWSGTAAGIALGKLLPAPVRLYPGEKKIKIIFLVDTPASRKPLLGVLKDTLNKEAAGRARLFGVKHITLLDFDSARKMKLPIQRLVDPK